MDSEFISGLAIRYCCLHAYCSEHSCRFFYDWVSRQ